MPFKCFSMPARLLGATLLVLGSAQAIAAGPTSQEAAQAQARYRQDLALCKSGQSDQSAQTCRLEARNALQAARRGGLTGPQDGDGHNATLRCAVHEGLDRSACEARMRGEGTRTEGSVGGGGILRETVIVVPGS